MRSFFPYQILFCLIGILFSWKCTSPKLYYFDLLIANGNLYDGVNPVQEGVDIGITGDSIVFIGKEEKISFEAKKVIDATDYVVAPGFIDPHTHALGDLSDTIRNSNMNYLFQGVTTVFTGSDGGGSVKIGELLSKWEDQGIGTNAVALIGHRPVRRLIMGMSDEEPSEEELDKMKSLIAKGMEAGALGFSSGLYYAPASFAKTEEVIELAKVAASYGGFYDVHIRDESSYNIGLIEAIKETIEIAEKANIPSNISHIKALGVDVWDKSEEVIQLVEGAQKRGLKITADQYPYRASGTHLDRALLPKWVFADMSDYQKKLINPDLIPRIKEGIKENLRRRGGPESILLLSAKMEELNGMNLAQVSTMWNLPPIETALKIMQNGSSAIASFNMKEEDIQNFMAQPWVMTSSDGTAAHPRKYGSFPKKIREYVLEKKVLSLEEMIRKSTSLTAQTFGIDRRGIIKEGYFADLIIFKPEEIKDEATFEKPSKLAIGMHYVIVNGQIAIHKGIYIGALAGRTIKRANN